MNIRFLSHLCFVVAVTISFHLVVSPIFCVAQDASGVQKSEVREVTHQVFPKVVKLYGAGGLKNLVNYGTGILISADGHILTVWNHLLDTDHLTVVLDDGRRLPAQFIGGAGEAGLAVLKIEVINAPHFSLDQVGRRGPGTPVLGFSNMFNVAAGSEHVSVIHGVIATVTALTARRGRFDVPYQGEVYIIDAITNNSGAAGGAIVSHDGVLLGVIGKELRDRRSNLWINYSIPLYDVKQTIGKLIRGEVITNEQTGLSPVIKTIDTLPLGFRLVPNVVPRTPAFIDAVLPGSLAEKAGLKSDDLIVLIDDDLIQSCHEFYEQLRESKKGDQLRITVRRNQQLFTVELIVPEFQK